MRKDLIEIVCCPVDKAKLELEGGESDDHGDVLAGILRCTECGFGYPIEDGIPNLLPPEYHVGNVRSKPKKGARAGTSKAPAASAGASPAKAGPRTANADPPAASAGPPADD